MYVCVCVLYILVGSCLCSCRLVDLIALALNRDVYLHGSERRNIKFTLNDRLKNVCPYCSVCVYIVRGDKLLSSAVCVYDRSPIAVHILCLWTQTEFSTYSYATAKGFCSRTTYR